MVVQLEKYQFFIINQKLILIISLCVQLDIVKCYFWYENQGLYGANEIGSCLYMYLEKMALLIDDKNSEFTFYSYNCGVQNKNRYIISLFLYDVRKQIIKRITSKFLICGHTQNKDDTVHSVVEKQIKFKKTELWSNLHSATVYFKCWLAADGCWDTSKLFLGIYRKPQGDFDIKKKTRYTASCIVCKKGHVCVNLRY